MTDREFFRDVLTPRRETLAEHVTSWVIILAILAVAAGFRAIDQPVVMHSQKVQKGR